MGWYADDAVIAGTCGSAWADLARIAPNITGIAKATIPTVTSNSFFAKFSLRIIFSFMTLPILFLRSAPVTPEMQAKGELTQNSQIFKMLSA